MKTILLFILIILSIGANCQNRFEKQFAKADSAFNAGYAFNRDSIVVDRIMHEISGDKTTMTINVELLMTIYFNAYISGANDFEQKRHFDFDEFLKYLKAQKVNIKYWQQYLKNHQ